MRPSSIPRFIVCLLLCWNIYPPLAVRAQEKPDSRASEQQKAWKEAGRHKEEFNQLMSLGKYEEAARVIEQALAILEKALDPNDPALIQPMNELAGIYAVKGDFLKAERLFQRSLKLGEKSLGAEHREIAYSLNGLADVYREQNRLAEAEPLLRRSIRILENTEGKDHPDVAIPLINLAKTLESSGNYTAAEEMHQRGLALLEKAEKNGSSLPGDPMTYLMATIGVLNELGGLSNRLGNYQKAESFYQRALKMSEEALGARHPITATPMLNLALLYQEKGDYPKAEPMFQRGLIVLETAYGREHPEVASVLINLANLCMQQGNSEKAEPLYQRALSILEKAFGPNHPKSVRALVGMADVFRASGKAAAAEPLYQRGLAILETSIGADHLDLGVILNSLAILNGQKGDHAKAEALFQRALDITVASLGANHPHVVKFLGNLATTSVNRRDTARAIAYQSRANAINEQNLILNLTAGSEQQKQAYLRTLLNQLDQTISLHVDAAPEDPAARNLAITAILQRKGRVLDVMSDVFRALRAGLKPKPEDQLLFDQLKEVSAQIAKLTIYGAKQIPALDLQTQLAVLDERKEKIEGEISNRGARRSIHTTTMITLKAVQAAIPADAALIEFMVYHPIFRTNENNSLPLPHYAAYVVRHNGEVQWKDLGEASVIERAIGSLRSALRDPKRKDVKEIARAVEERVMRPLRAMIGNATHLIISPDGALNLIPFAALVDEADRFLIERYTFTYLNSGRELLLLNPPPSPDRLLYVVGKSEKPLVIANPIFGEPEASSPETPRLTKKRQGRSSPPHRPQMRQVKTTGVNLSEVYFTPLDGTALEAQAIKSLFPDVALLMGAQATESALKQAVSPKILHLATHGFFLDDQFSPPSGVRGFETLDGSQPNLPLENPLLRSGLALAGANLKQSDSEDGILTAMEAATLNLFGTSLVVLSACDTGVGEVKNGEGVYGLRRAFALAGAETQIMSLWPVADYITRKQMIGYYEGLKHGQGRGEALRRAQLRMLQQPDLRHPFFWAGFIQSGAWTPLPIKQI